MPQYSLLGGLADPSYMTGVTTQGQPYIDPITGRLVTGTGDLYTGERPLETPPLRLPEGYEPEAVPAPLGPEALRGIYESQAKPDYSPGKIASLILTSPLRLLSGLDQELKGALGIPTLEDTAEYGRTHYGGGEPTGFGERLLGALTGESRTEANAALATRADELLNAKRRSTALQNNRRLQQIFGGAYENYGKPTTLEKGERELEIQRRFGLPSAAADFESKLRNLQILRETGLPQALATLEKTRQGIELGGQQLDLNDLELKIKAIKYRADRGDEDARVLYDYYFNHPNPEVRGAVRGFIGASAKLLENEPMPPATGEAIRKSTQEGITAQSGSLANLNTAGNMRNPATGLTMAEQTAADTAKAINDMKDELARVKAALEAKDKERVETRAGHDDISAAFEKYMPTQEQVTGDKNARFWDALHAVAPGKVKPSVGAQRTDMLTRKDDVLALYNAHRITKEQAIELANPARSIADVLPDYEAALAEIRAGKPAAEPTPNPTPTIDPIDRVVTEEDTPRPRPTATPGTARLPSDVQDSREPDHRQLDDESEAKKFYMDEWKRRFGSESARDKKGRTANDLFPFFYSSTGPSGWDAQKKELRK